MPFGQPQDRYFSNVFAPAVVDAGLDPIRADSLFRSTNIVGDIWRLTREATLLLADLSGKNPNVFYELGLAHAVGKPVILVSATVDDVPFDLRHLRVLIYDKEDEAWGTRLQERVTEAVRETLSDMSGAIPLPFLETGGSKKPKKKDPTRRELSRLWSEIDSLRSEALRWRRAARSYETPPPVRDVSLLHHLRRNTRPADIKWASDGSLGIIVSYLMANQKIQAIRFVREVSGRGLSQAKHIVDHLGAVMEKMGIISGYSAPPS
jgi:hypothetical protein